LKAQRTALVQCTEEPIRQGRLDDPWEGAVGGAILGDAAEAVALFRRFWRQAERRPECAAFVRRLRKECQ